VTVGPAVPPQGQAQAAGGSGAASIAGCPLFPPDNPWRRNIAHDPVSAHSAAWVASVGTRAFLHPDFGANPSYGIPYAVVPAGQPKVKIAFNAYGDESDPGPYPIPANARVEGGGDRHVLVASGNCHIYELYGAARSGSGWTAASGAVFDLRSNALRHDGWTSADAAGLPILPGLVRYDEVAAGAIRHALRFTAKSTARAHIYPARHDAGASGGSLPPMGLRVRLKASVDISHYGKQARTVLQALMTYGMILADNGSNWFISGASDHRYSDDDLPDLGKIKG
jgi:hypothetical protein